MKVGEQSKYKCNRNYAKRVTLTLLLTIKELLTGSLVMYLLTEGTTQKNQSGSQEEVDKLNKENAKRENSVLPQIDPAKFHTEGPEEEGESLAFESCCRRSSVQKSFTTEKQQEEEAVDDACQRITGQEGESGSPADRERKEEHQVSGDERQEERENEGERIADEGEKEVEELPAPSQNEDEAGQSYDQETAEGR